MDQQVSHSLDDFYLAIDSQSVFTGTISQIIKLQIHRFYLGRTNFTKLLRLTV